MRLCVRGMNVRLCVRVTNVMLCDNVMKAMSHENFDNISGPHIADFKIFVWFTSYGGYEL